MSYHTEGVAYRATERLDVTEIAKRIRVGLRNAQELGGLPAEMTWTVQVSRGSMCRAIDVRLSGMPDSWTYLEPGLEPDYCAHPAVPHHGGHTDAANSALKIAEEIHAAYNFNDSDSMTDYFHVNYYGQVKITDEAGQWWDGQTRYVRAAQASAAAARKAAGIPTRGSDAQRAAARVARDATAEYCAANPRPYGNR